MFNSLLREIGFSTRLISAEVNNEGTFGPPFDHLAVVVELDKLWLVDVGFGDLFFEPVRIQAGSWQRDRDYDYQVEKVGEDVFHLLAAAPGAADFEPKYRFDTQPRRMEDFAEQCHIIQYSPESHFVRNFICTLPTAEGRKTVRNGVFKVRRGAEVQEQTIKNDAELLAILAKEFGLV